MAWEERNRSKQKYYYRSHRAANGKVVKEYIGSGPDAELAAEMDTLKRAKRQAADQGVKMEEQRIEQAAAPLNELGEDVDTLLQAALMAAGFHYHRGEWRKRRNDRN